MINNKKYSKSGSGSSWESRDVDTRGRGWPTNHPQFSAINCCQLRIGSCRPDLCRILGAFLHFPDNRNCGSQVICGGGGSLPLQVLQPSRTRKTKTISTNKHYEKKKTMKSRPAAVALCTTTTIVQTIKEEKLQSCSAITMSWQVNI